jgi:uncharacterized membrane protein YesL
MKEVIPMRLFDPEGPLMTALSKLADIVICNLMFVLFSLPIITFGASLAALYTCMLRLVEDEDRDDGLIFRTFWFAFRDNFKQATLLWLICLGGIAFLSAYYWTVHSLAASFSRVYQITFFILVLLFFFGFLYLFPLQARYENSIRNTLRNAWLMSVAALPWTLLNLVLLVAAVYISFIMNPGAVEIFAYLWAVCGFGLIAYLQCFLFRQAFRKLSPEQLSQNSQPAEGAIFTDEEHQTEDLMTPPVTNYSNPDWNRRDDLFPPEKKTTKQRVNTGRSRRR